MSEDLQPVNYSADNGLLEARSNSMGAVHYYQQDYEDGPKKQIKGDDFAEQMVPGLAEDRKKYLEDHAEEAREWKHREKAGNLVNEDGRLLTPEGKLAFPTKKDKAKEIGKKITVVVKNGAEGLKGVSNETKDKVMEALAANQVEEARQMLKNAGIDVKEEKPGETTVYSPAQEKGEKKEDHERTGPAIITTKKGEIEGEVVGPSPKYPEGRNPRDNSLHYQVKVQLDNGKEAVWNDVNSLNVKFKEDASEAQTGVIDKGEKNERREFLETVLRLQKQVDEKFQQAQKENTILRLDKDESLKQRALGQIREDVVDDYMRSLPESENGDKKLKGHLLDALKEDPDKLRSEMNQLSTTPAEDREIGNKVGNPGEMEIRGQSADGSPFIYRKNEKGEWVVSRNGNLAKEWFPATSEGMMRDIGIDLISPVPAGGGSEPAPGRSYEPGGGALKSEEVDEEAMETSMAKIKSLNEELKTASPERAKEIQKEIEAEIAKMYKVWEGASDAGGEPEPAPDEPPEEVKEAEEGKPGRLRRAWNRAKNASFLPWNLYTRHFVMEEDPKRRKYKSLALLAGGILVGALLSRYGFSHGGGGHEHVTGGGIFPGHDHTPEHGAHGIEHQTFFESAAGHRRTGLVLPEGLHPGHDAEGHRIILDNNGNVVVSHAEAPDLAKESGVLSDKAAEVLRSKDYTVSYMPMDNVAGTNSNLYESVVS